jgi:hypothetical protein
MLFDVQECNTPLCLELVESQGGAAPATRASAFNNIDSQRPLSQTAYKMSHWVLGSYYHLP